MELFIQLVINGLLLGGAYTIISLGLTLIFGVVRVVNFAHGEFLMIGMYMVYLIAAHFGVHPYAGLIPVAVILFALGALTQKGIIQPLLHADQHIQIFATVGVSTILLNLALVTRPRRDSTNQRLATMAPSTRAIEPVPTPTAIPHRNQSCHADVITSVSPLPSATRRRAPTMTRRRPNLSIRAAANGAVSP